MISDILRWFKRPQKEAASKYYTAAFVGLLEKRIEIKEERIKTLKGDILKLRELIRDIWMDLDQCAGRSGNADWMPTELRQETAEKIMIAQGLRFGKGRIRNV